MGSNRRSLLVAGLVVWAAAGGACGGGEPSVRPTPPPPAAPLAACPVCAGSVAPERAVDVAGLNGVRQVCSKGCAIRFEASPDKFGSK